MRNVADKFGMKLRHPIPCDSKFAEVFGASGLLGVKIEIEQLKKGYAGGSRPVCGD
jgi:hypothetical protein